MDIRNYFQRKSLPSSDDCKEKEKKNDYSREKSLTAVKQKTSKTKDRDDDQCDRMAFNQKAIVKSHKKHVNGDGDDDEDPMPLKKSAKKGSKSSKELSTKKSIIIDDDDDDDEDIFAKKKSSKGKKIFNDDDDEDPMPSSSRKRSVKSVSKHRKSDQFDDDDHSPLKKKTKVKRKNDDDDIEVVKEVSKKQKKSDNHSPLKKYHKSERINDDIKGYDTKKSPSKAMKKDNDIKIKNETTKGSPPKSNHKSDIKAKETKSDSKNNSKVKSPTKRNKTDDAFDDDLLADVKDSKEEPKKKRFDYASYMSFQNREGPRALGSKDIPPPCEGVLSGMNMIITGILESIERDDAIKLIQDCGGKVMKTLGKTTKYVIIGRDPGPSKIRKAEELGTEQLDEDALFELIKEKSKSVVKDKKNDKSKELDKKKVTPKKETPKKSYDPIAAKITPKKFMETKNKTSQKEKLSSEPIHRQTSQSKESEHLWVDRHKPKTSDKVIGQNGEKSCVKKLTHWLRHWHQNLDKKPGFGKWASDDGAGFRAALLSGPPGIGKTTSAQLVCQELGYDYVELNASDTRSKKSLHEEVQELLNNKTLTNFGAANHSKSVLTHKHVLIMDEVDGMSGNEDRGGVQELILLIKKTKVPLICICNDRSHPKMRSLVNYCFDLRFYRPRVEQIKAAMMSVAFKEGIQITSQALHELIVSSNQDIRQIIHYMSLMSCGENNKINGLINDKAIKDVRIGPFDALKKVFSTGAEYAAMSYQDKADLFFSDYSIMPLFVWENYLSVAPIKAKGNELKKLKLASKAMDSIAYGGIIEKEIRTNNNWSLLPIQAAFSSVIPGALMNGYISSLINFPSFLGKMSTTNKRDRLLQELMMHMNLKVSGSKTSLNLDYLQPLCDAIIQPLIKDGNDGVSQTLERLHNYCLRREDIETIIEMTLWENQTDPMSKVDSKTKAALTRAYNKDGFTLPYSLGTVKKGKGRAKANDEYDNDNEFGNDDDGNGEDDNDESEDIDLDAMIKAKKKTNKKVSKNLNEDDTKKKTKAKNTKSSKSPTKARSKKK